MHSPRDRPAMSWAMNGQCPAASRSSAKRPAAAPWSAPSRYKSVSALPIVPLFLINLRRGIQHVLRLALDIRTAVALRQVLKHAANAAIAFHRVNGEDRLV